MSTDVAWIYAIKYASKLRCDGKYLEVFVPLGTEFAKRNGRVIGARAPCSPDVKITAVTSEDGGAWVRMEREEGTGLEVDKYDVQILLDRVP